MSASGISRRNRLVLAVVGVVFLYGLAVLAFFKWWTPEWGRAVRAYDKAAAKLAGEKQLIRDRNVWSERLERSQLQMPMIDEDELSVTRWKRVVEGLARDHNFHILGYNSDGREEDLGEVWELALDIQYRSSLQRLIEFFYALDTTEEGLFDIRQLEISTKKPGELTGKFTLTCAYKKGSSK